MTITQPEAKRIADGLQFNIILAYRGLRMLGDYEKIAEKIHAIASGAAVYLLPDALLPPVMLQRLNSLPSITFSPMKLRYLVPPRGPVFTGQSIPKSQQMRLMAKAGVRVPKWTFLAPGKTFTETEWGKVVILKPDAFGASRGRGVELVRISAVRFVPPVSYSTDHLGRKGHMIVQQFIDTGPFSEDYRVVTIFGHPLYALKRCLLAPMEDILTTGAERTSSGVASNAGAGGEREVHLCYDKAVLDLAHRVYLAIPQVPFQAIDIRQDIRTGHLYCLEINPGGNTWHFSSKRAELVPTIDGLRREDQFGAWDIAAKALVTRARSQAA
jgi:hypothetical protein